MTDITTDAAAKPESRAAYWQLLLLSVVSLFLELLFIRWLAGDLRAFTIFKSFPLVVCFVGLGYGCNRQNDKLFRYLPFALLLSVIAKNIPELLGVAHIIGFPSASVNDQFRNVIHFIDPALLISIGLFTGLLFCTLLGPFVVMAAIGSRLGVLFNELKPLHAYTVNLLGAIIGSVLFSVLTFAGWSPALCMAPALVALVPLLWKLDPNKMGVLAANVVLLGATFGACFIDLDPHFITLIKLGDINHQKRVTVWSPYSRLDAFANESGNTLLGWHIFANKSEYQIAGDYTGKTYDIQKLPADVQKNLDMYHHRFTVPFNIRKNPGDVLIVGAGSGSDVQEALMQGARTVDGVDIDPQIVEMGRTMNPFKPYEDPRVHIYIDDARHFFNTCNKKYDLIFFSHLDSHLVAGNAGSSVRLDNYVYTKQSYEKVLRLLKPDGMMVVSFFSAHKWFIDRFYETLRNALGYNPLVLQNTERTAPNIVFIAGEGVKNGTIKIPPEEEGYMRQLDLTNHPPTNILTDDWPYLYVTPKTIDIPYLFVLAEILLIATFAGRKLLFAPAPARGWQLFFMGAAFMLLELQAISRLSLLYGSSWLCSAVVINGVLVMILFANIIALKFGPQLVPRQNMLYALLFVSLAVSFWLPVQPLLEAAGAAGYAIATAITVLPMFAAGMIFSTSFSTVTNPAKALAFNLFGAVIGALLEYLSNYIGINALVLVASALYLVSYVCSLPALKAYKLSLANPAT